MADSENSQKNTETPIEDEQPKIVKSKRAQPRSPGQIESLERARAKAKELRAQMKVVNQANKPKKKSKLEQRLEEAQQQQQVKEAPPQVKDTPPPPPQVKESPPAPQQVKEAPPPPPQVKEAPPQVKEAPPPKKRVGFVRDADGFFIIT